MKIGENNLITLAVNELIKDVVNEKIYRLLWIDEVYDFSYVIYNYILILSPVISWVILFEM